MEGYGNIDVQHSLKNVGKPIRSWITEEDKVYKGVGRVPKGSWMMSVRIQDDDTWSSIKSGKINGFSIMGMREPAFKSANAVAEYPEAYAAVVKSAQKRTTLADLGPDWFVNAVSVVDDPAVPKAKFIAIKSKGDEGSTGGGWLSKFFGSIKAVPPQPPQQDQPPQQQPPDQPGATPSAEEVKGAIEVLNRFVEALSAAQGGQQPQQPGQPPVQKSKGGIVVDEAKLQEMINAAVKAAMKEANNAQEGDIKDKGNTTESAAQGETGGTETVTIPKADYENLVSQVNELSGVVQKAKNTGMFFGSRSMFGQDGEHPNGAEKSKPDPLEQESRDSFGRWILSQK